MENISQMSLLEVAVQLMEENKDGMDIHELIKKVLELKGIEDTDGTYTTQLYVDITTSSKFVYMGENKWDLKLRQPLEQFDKDGSAFNSKEDEYHDEEEEDIVLDEESDEDDDLEGDSDDEDDDIESDEDEDDDLDDHDDHDESIESDDELDDDTDDIDIDDDFDEDKYDKYMDDYEDMYDEN